MGNIRSIKRRTDRLTTLWQKHRKGVLISIKLQILSDKLIYNQVLVRKIRSIWRSIIQGTEYLCSDFCSNLGQYTPFFQSLFQYLFQFVYRSHLFFKYLKINYLLYNNFIQTNLITCKMHTKRYFQNQQQNLRQIYILVIQYKSESKSIISLEMALHSAYDKTFNCRIACGFPILPIKTKIDGPGNLPFNPLNNRDIIDEAFQFFRINVLFKNFQINGHGDKVLIYLLVLISHLFKVTQNIKQVGQAQKRLTQISGAKIPLPKQKSNFISMILDDGNGPQRELYANYTKQIRAETIRRFLQRFYNDGLAIQDFKFWSGPAKKKFMGLNYTSMF